MNPFIKSMMQAADNPMASVLEDGLATDSSGFVDTGSMAFNALLSGGIDKGMPDNKIICLAGDPATGKTYFAMGIAAAFQRNNPDGLVFYWDSEQAISGVMFEARGLDPSRTAVMPVATIEDFRHQCIKIVDNVLELPADKRPRMMFILDSLGNLSTRKEMSDTADNKDTRDMTKAGLIRGTFRTLTIKLGMAKIPLVVTNHTYDVIGSMFPMKEMSGGAGLKYNASIIVHLAKRKDKDSEKNVIGTILKCKLTKSRITKEEKIVEVQLNYDTGLNRHYGLLEIAEEAGILTRVANKVKFPNGKTAYPSVVLKEPEKWFTVDLLALIDTACAKEFLYQQGSGQAEGDQEEVEE